MKKTDEKATPEETGIHNAATEKVMEEVAVSALKENTDAKKKTGKKSITKISAKSNSPYIVGMGGSAGSLEAFEQFFEAMPHDSGLTFVLIPHLDPTHKGIMPEILQRTAKMRVLQAEDGMKAMPT